MGSILTHHWVLYTCVPHTNIFADLFIYKSLGTYLIFKTWIGLKQTTLHSIVFWMTSHFSRFYLDGFATQIRRSVRKVRVRVRKVRVGVRKVRVRKVRVRK